MKILFNLEEQEAQAFDGNKKIGYCQFEKKFENVWDITHTVVNKEYGGQGIALKLLDEVVKNAKENNKKLIPTCSYAVKKFDNDKEKYSDVLY